MDKRRLLLIFGIILLFVSIGSLLMGIIVPKQIDYKLRVTGSELAKLQNSTSDAWAKVPGSRGYTI